MRIIPALLFGISASLDALLVGITFGIRGIHIKFWQNLFISIITLLGTCLSVGLGTKLTLLLSAHIWRFLGSCILILFGLYYVTKYMIEKLKKYHTHQPLTASQIHSSANELPHIMTLPEVCTMGCALSANNMGIGLSASIAGLSLLPAATVTLLFSFLFLFLGNRLGFCQALQLTEKTTNLISGLLLIGLGILELIH